MYFDNFFLLVIGKDVPFTCLALNGLFLSPLNSTSDMGILVTSGVDPETKMAGGGGLLLNFRRCF